MWLNALCLRWMGRPSRKIRRRLARQRPFIHPLLEALEDRTLLSAPVVAPGSVPLNGGVSASGSQFIGIGDKGQVPSQSLSASGGGIYQSFFGGQYGAQASLNFDLNQLGYALNYQATTGQGSVTYPNVSLQQNYKEPTQSGQEVSFTPQVSYSGGGSFSTAGPSLSLSDSLDASVSGSIAGEVAVVDSAGGSANFGGSISVPLFGMTMGPNQTTNQFGLTDLSILGLDPSILGQNFASVLNAIVKQKTKVTAQAQIDEDPPLYVQGVLSGTSNPFGLHEQLNLGAGQVASGMTQGNSTSSGVTTNLASMDQYAPDLALSSNSLQSNGVLTATGQGTLADLNVQMGPIVGALVGFPEVGALASTINVSLGKVSLSFTPVSFQVGASLNYVQTGTITPTNSLTYNFSTPVVVTLDGVKQNGGNPESSVTFTPGVDTVSIQFSGTPITVRPVWNFGLNYTNELDLDAAFTGTLTAGQLSGPLGLNLGPLYTHTFDFANYKLGTFYDNTTPIYSVTTGSKGVAALSSFIIGPTYQPSLEVTTTQDGNTTYNQQAGTPGTLRMAVQSANQFASGPTGGAQQIIQLGAGTYNLQSIYGNALEVGTYNGSNAPTNLIIEGAGAGQTIINAAGLGDRILKVDSGSTLTLEGVTLENGGATEGGAIYNSGTLTIRDSAISDNKAQGTSGINGANGTVRARNGGNGVAGGNGLGGGLYVAGGSVNLTNDTFSGNIAQGGNGGNGGNGVNFNSNNNVAGGNGGNGSLGGNGLGGGLYVAAGSVILTNDTLSGNKALAGNGGAGGAGGNGYVTHQSFATPGGNGGSGGNAGMGEGGALWSAGGGAVLLNDTISGNKATGGNGGNAGNAGAGSSNLSHGASGNGSNGGNGGNGAGGGLYVFGGTSLANTLIAENNVTAGTGGAGTQGFNGIGSSGINGSSKGSDVDGVVASSDHDLIGDGTGSNLSNGSNGDLVGTSANRINPLLAPLGNYGGPTQTLALLPGSPAIDAGDNNPSIAALPSTDQRGYARISNGHVDIGAAEYQYDLGLTGSLVLGSASGTAQYVYTVTNNGPDTAGNGGGVTLTVGLPGGAFEQSISPPPSGWSVYNVSGTITATTPTLASGAAATFTITVQLPSTAAGSIYNNTATLGPTTWDNNRQNNSLPLGLFYEQEGQTFDAVPLYHFADANPNETANDFTVSVGWGDGSGNTSSDGSGTVSVVADPNGGFDVLGSHTYAEEGNHPITVEVTGLDGTQTGTPIISGVPVVQQLFVVADAPLTAGALTPPPNAAINQPIATFNNVVLYHFTDTKNPSAPASDFTASVGWGDGNSNSSSDGSNTVSVVADANGGFDVVGSHNYAAVGSYGISVTVAGSDGTTYNNVLANKQIPTFQYGAKLFHFTDANPTATPSDYTATVTWGDGTTNSSSDSSGTVAVVADPNGGFDVLGSHTYTQILEAATLGVQVTDAGGSTTPTMSGPIYVLNPDKALTAGTLNVPSVTTEGQSISNQVLFQFTDPDTSAQASDYLATVSWGDGTFTSSNDGSGSVQVVEVGSVAGGLLFNVVGSHTYGEGSFNFAVKVTDLGDAGLDGGGQITGAASTTPLTISDPAVAATAGPTFTASENSLSSAQTVATFTDPGGSETAPTAYVATIQWGDGTVTEATLVSQLNYAAANLASSYVPSVNTPTVSNSGGTLAAGAYYYTVTSTTANGESTPSSEVTATTTGSTSAVSLSWGAVAGATGYKIYRGTSPGTEDTIIANITSGTTLSFTDDGNEITYAAPPQQIIGHFLVSSSNTPGIVLGSDGKTFSINLDHQYAAEGQYPIAITIDHNGILSQVTNTANVADPAVVVTAGSTFSATEGDISNVQTVATFTDPAGPESDPNAYTATVQWGDGSSSTATLGNGGIVLGSDGQTFAVNLAHQYADEGTYTITIVLNHDGVLSSPVTTTATVADNDNLTATAAAPITSNYGAPLTNVTLATFTDTYTGNAASDFAATINWGDKQTSTGTVSGGNGNFTVTGSHSYTDAGAYSISVSITDDGTATAAAAADTLTVSSASTQTSLLTTAASSSYSAATPQTVMLSALVNSGNGVLVQSGVVTFTVVNPNGTNLTATANVAGGIATAALSVPAGFPPGSYVFDASYADVLNTLGNVNYNSSTAAASGTLTVNVAQSHILAATPVRTVYSSTTPQTVTLTATVASPGGANEGGVTFTVVNPFGGSLTTSGVVNSNGTATAPLTLPAGFSAGTYLVTVSYADNSSSNFASSSGTTTLFVAPAATTTSLRQILIVPVSDFAVEWITAGVTSPGGTVNGGSVTFNIDGTVVNAAVQSGQATAMAVLPLLDAALPEQIGLSFTPPNFNFAASTAAESALLTLLNALDFGFVLLNSDGSQTVAVILNGVPIGLVFNAHGQFTGFAFDIVPALP